MSATLSALQQRKERLDEELKQTEKLANAKVEAIEKVLAALPDGNTLKEYREALEKDLASAKKVGSVKSMAAQIEVTAGFVEREAKRLNEVEADILKATEALAERKVALAAEQSALVAMKEELVKQGETRDDEDAEMES